MEFILREPGDDIDFERYLEYLKSVRTSLPGHIYEFASNPSNFNLSDSQSLHDAWLDYFNIVEPAEGDRKELRRIDINTRYLGPFHDLRIYIDYLDVISYSLNTPEEFSSPGDSATGHGDLITHEIRVAQGGTFIHELLFSGGSSMTIQFRDLQHRVEVYSHV